MNFLREGQLLLMTLLAVSLVPGMRVPRMVSYGVVAVVYTVVLTVCYIRGRLAIAYNQPTLYLTGCLWVVFALVFVLYPTPKSLLRTGSFIVFSGIVLFVIPGTFSREEFLDSLSLLATIVGEMTLPLAAPALLSGNSGLGIWKTVQPVQSGGIGLPVFTSIFWNPNYLAAISTLGLIALLGFAREPRRRRFAIFCGVLCLSALLLSQGRAALLAFLGGGILYIVYRMGGSRLATPVVAIGILGAVLFFVLVFVSVSGFTVPASLLNHRKGLWTAALAATGDHPLLGWGLIDTEQVLADYGAPSSNGTHNSFLRMFLMTGIIGGVLYCSLVCVVLYRSLRFEENSSSTPGVVLSLLAVTFIIQMFNGSTLFGLSLVSLFSGIVIGYGQQPSVKISFKELVDVLPVSEIRNRITNKV